MGDKGDPDSPSARARRRLLTWIEMIIVGLLVALLSYVIFHPKCGPLKLGSFELNVFPEGCDGRSSVKLKPAPRSGMAGAAVEALRQARLVFVNSSPTADHPELANAYLVTADGRRYALADFFGAAFEDFIDPAQRALGILLFDVPRGVVFSSLELIDTAGNSVVIPIGLL